MAATHWKVSSSAPTLLTEALTSPLVGGDLRLQVLSVHMHDVYLDPSLGGRRFRLCVEYGEKGSAVSRKTHSKRYVAPNPSEQTEASQQKQQRRQTTAVDESAMFLWSKAQQPLITLRLMETGIFCSRTLAETELDLHLSPEGLLSSKLVEESLVLRATRGRPGEVFGRARVSISLRDVRKGELLTKLRPLGLRMKSSGAVHVCGGLQ